MKTRFNWKSFLMRIFLVIGVIVLATTGIQLLYLSRLGPVPTASPLAMYVGIVLLNSVMGVLITVSIRALYLRLLARPLLNISDILKTGRLPQPDVATSLQHAACPEMQTLSNAAITLMTNLRSSLTQVHEAGQQILDASKFVFSTSKTQLSLLTSQTEPTHEMTIAVRELVLTAQHISRDIHAVVEMANRTLQFAEHGQRSVMNVVKSMEDIQRSSQVSSDKIAVLEKQSEHITEVVKTIDRIIEDTKLIAFNATIEAARAKDGGKGFGVVALEIRRLAEEVFESTEDIKELIREIQGGSHDLVLATEQEMKTVRRGVLLAEEAGTSFTQIVDMIKGTSDSARRIASAAEQQQGASEQVLQAVETARQSTEQFAREIKTLAVTAAELNILSEGLQHFIPDPL
jgi:methyl-accepting chemotaxis protein